MKLKRAFALLPAAVLACAVPVTASAESQDLSLTTEVESSYILSIPMSVSQGGGSKSIIFGTVDTDIGSVSVTGNVKPGASVQVTATKTDFTKSDGKASIPFSLYASGKDFASASWNETELRTTPAKEIPLTVHITTDAWNKAEAGDYKATITFTAQLKES